MPSSYDSVIRQLSVGTKVQVREEDDDSPFEGIVHKVDLKLVCPDWRHASSTSVGRRRPCRRWTWRPTPRRTRRSRTPTGGRGEKSGFEAQH